MKKTISKKFVLCVLLLFAAGIISAQPVNKTDSLGRKQGFWKKYVNDTLRYEGNFINNKPSGEFKYYFYEGKIKAITQYSDSGRHAQTIVYFINGKKNAEGLYIDKKKEGLWLYYGTNEKIISEENYKNGIKEGAWKYFYENGKINKIENYKSGILDGDCLEYYEDSILKMKCVFQKGKMNGKYQYFYISGKILYTGYYKNDLKDGEWMFFNENGFGDRKLTYKNGILDKEEIVVQSQGTSKFVNADEIAYCFSDKSSVHIKLNSGDDIVVSLNLTDLEKLLDQFNFLRINPDFIISRWSVKNRKTFTKENPVIVLNPDPGTKVLVHSDKLEAFMSWVALIKYE